MWNTKTPGIPDEFFERDEGVPITKEEVRVVQISKARLKPGMIIYDIGCGSGSISVEAAPPLHPTRASLSRGGSWSAARATAAAAARSRAGRTSARSAMDR